MRIRTSIYTVAFLLLSAALLTPTLLAQTPSAAKAVEKVVDAAAQEQAAATQPQSNTADRSSPRATIQTFITNMYDNAGFYNQTTMSEAQLAKELAPAIACLNLSTTLDGDRPEIGADLAKQLYAILNRIRYIKFEDITNDPDAADERDQHIYLVFPETLEEQNTFEARLGVHELAGRIVLRRNDQKQWLFDTQTVAAIPKLYEQFLKIPPIAGRSYNTIGEYIESAIPGSFQKSFLTIKYWQWIAIFFVVFFGLAIDLFFRILVRTVSHRVMKKGRITEQHRDTIKHAARPIGLLAAAIFWLLVMRLLSLEENYIANILDSALRIYIAVIATLAEWRLVDLIAAYLQAKAKHTESKFDDVLIPLVTKTCKIFIVIIGVVYAANALDIPIAPLLASIGIASVGVSFALKDTVENFFGSVAVLLDRPFDVGDWVVIESSEGIVEEVGFRSTRIRTFYNSQITIPNSNLVKAKVDNYGRRKYRRWKTNLCLQYDTTPDTLIAFTEGVRELIRTHPYTRKDYYEVYCNEFGDSSLNILLYVFFEVPDWNTELRERERLFIDIVRLADAVGAQFAFPTRTVHLFNEDGSELTRQNPDPQSMTERRAMVAGLRAAKSLTENQPWTQTKPDPVVITMDPTELPDDYDPDVKLDDAGNPIIERKPDDEDKAPSAEDTDEPHKD
ncbi:mechanosensitive ion channel family protein [Poriferisphaera sp. WC338]|uniref:mechanosensitive ion channel family protein n=1 Tax=Poriferisphaera sp. WC338 TaxID=3425129 RepID=UPI003D81B23C